MRPTRGHGRLEGFLARMRVRQALRLLPPSFAAGRVLDVGCGSYPLFLASSPFAEKHGLDRVAIARPRGAGAELTLQHFDFTGGEPLPYPDGFFDAVAMLAVYEHLAAEPLARLLGEIRRVLKPGGVFVMTTPAGWTEPLLSLLGRLGLISAEELDEHQAVYGSAEIRAALERAGFPPDGISLGYFELGMNNWARATA